MKYILKQWNLMTFDGLEIRKYFKSVFLGFRDENGDWNGSTSRVYRHITHHIYQTERNSKL